MRAQLWVTAWALGPGLLASASLVHGAEPAERFDDLAVLKAEVAMLRGTLRRQAEQIEKLKGESRPSQGELAALRAELAKYREENDRLRKQIEGFTKATGPANRKGVTFVPLMGDETSVAQIIADRRKYLGKVVTLCGGVALSNYYGVAYHDAERTHVSLDFDEVGADGQRVAGNSNLHLYVRREIAGPLVTACTETVKAGSSKKLVRVRAVTSSAPTDAILGCQLELLGWQFLEPDGTRWGPWAQKTTDKQPRPTKAK